MNETEIKDFFKANRPQTSDEGTFIAGLSARMDAATEIKRLHDEAIRRYRLTALITLIAGIVIGGLVIALILLHPVSAPQLRSDLFARILAFAAEWKYIGFLLIASTAIILGLKPLSASGNSRSTRPF